MDQLTAQGYDMQFGTNVLGHFLLLKLLHPVLAASSSPAAPTRLVWTSSSVNYYFSAPVKYDTLKDGPARRALGASQLYCQSKFATILLVLHLARTCSKDGVVAIVVDPGNIKSDLQRYGPDGAISGVMRKAMVSSTTSDMWTTRLTTRLPVACRNIASSGIRRVDAAVRRDGPRSC